MAVSRLTIGGETRWDGLAESGALCPDPVRTDVCQGCMKGCSDGEVAEEGGLEKGGPESVEP